MKRPLHHGSVSHPYIFRFDILEAFRARENETGIKKRRARGEDSGEIQTSEDSQKILKAPSGFSHFKKNFKEKVLTGPAFSFQASNTVAIIHMLAMPCLAAVPFGYNLGLFPINTTCGCQCFYEQPGCLCKTKTAKEERTLRERMLTKMAFDSEAKWLGQYKMGGM